LNYSRICMQQSQAHHLGNQRQIDDDDNRTQMR